MLIGRGDAARPAGLGEFTRAFTFLIGPRPRLFLVLALAFTLFVGTDQSGRTLSADGARYALIGREIVERGDPSRLTLAGKPYAKKPPLFFWLEAAAFSVFGFTEAAARLPSRAFGLASVALLMMLAARHHGHRTAFWAGLAMTTWHAFQKSACTVRLDSTLTFFTLASLGAFLAMDRRGATPWRSLGLGTLIGLSVLTKGPPGLLPLAAIAVGAALSGRSRLLLETAPFAIAAAAVVAGPWYCLQLVREGPQWSAELARDWFYSKEAGFAGVVGLYCREFFLIAAPWVAIAAFGSLLAVRRLWMHRRRSLPEALLLSLCLVLAIGVGCRASHHARYLIPLVPALAWLGAIRLAPMLRRLGAERLAAGAIAVAVLAGYPLALAIGVPKMRIKYEDVRRAAEFVRNTDPDARVIPTWPPSIGAGISEATRFYFGLSLVPFDPANLTQPPFVLLRDRDRRSELEDVHHLEVLFAGPEHILYTVPRAAGLPLGGVPRGTPPAPPGSIRKG